MVYSDYSKPLIQGQRMYPADLLGKDVSDRWDPKLIAADLPAWVLPVSAGAVAFLGGVVIFKTLKKKKRR